jgi:epoxide hydrolase 4
MYGGMIRTGKPQYKSGLNGTWEWLENDWTLLTIRHAGHFVQHDAADLVTLNILNWLVR